MNTAGTNHTYEYSISPGVILLLCMETLSEEAKRAFDEYQHFTMNHRGKFPGRAEQAKRTYEDLTGQSIEEATAAALEIQDAVRRELRGSVRRARTAKTARP